MKTSETFVLKRHIRVSGRLPAATGKLVRVTDTCGSASHRIRGDAFAPARVEALLDRHVTVKGLTRDLGSVGRVAVRKGR